MRELLVPMAMMLLALFGAGCADEPQQQAQLAARSTKVAATAPATPAAVNDVDPVNCVYAIPNGTMIHKWMCPTVASNPSGRR